jgi:hypothetical protein
MFDSVTEEIKYVLELFNGKCGLILLLSNGFLRGK